MCNREWIGWIAGIIDGEGSLMIPLSGTRGPRPVCRCSICVENTSRAMIEKLVEYSGIGQVMYRKRRTSSGNAVYAWTVSGARCGDILKEIYPFIVAKRRQADALIWLSDRIKRRCGREHTGALTEEEHALRLQAREYVKACNKGRGECRTKKRPTWMRQ